MAQITFKNLGEKIKEQLSYEYHSQDRIDHAYDNMTVPELLEMLSYMEDKE